MARRRWTEEKRITREAVTWLHLLLQEQGPMSTPAIIGALQAAGREVRVHELQRALRRSEHVHAVGSERGPRVKVTVWAWEIRD